MSPPAADLLVRRVGRLLTVGGPVLPAAAVEIRAGRVRWFGPDRSLPAGLGELPELDADGAAVLPGFVDAHTHLVWAGHRRQEFLARLAGARYDGGGIRRTVAATRSTSTQRLTELVGRRLQAAVRSGTTTVEVKTGYGLSAAEELRALDVVAELAATQPLRVHATYLGAHVVPDGVDRPDYLAEVTATMPAARDRGARWCDVFCDRGAFDLAETERVLRAGAAAGLGLRVHAEQLTHTGAAGLAARLGAASADHLDHVTDAEARGLAAAGVVGVLLPTVALTVPGAPTGHVARLRTAGVELAVATDCNPGTSWCESMPFAVQLACLLFRLPVGEAVRAATLGGAHALGRDDVGALLPGRWGDLVVLTAEHEADLVAHLGAPAIRETVIGGRPVTVGAGSAAG